MTGKHTVYIYSSNINFYFKIPSFFQQNFHRIVSTITIFGVAYFYCELVISEIRF